MQCPIDGAELVMTDRSGVEIDYCPKCRGVWLDRGELDKIIERAAPPAPPPPPSSGRQRDYDDDDSYGRRDDRRKSGYRKKDRGGILGELFDF